MDSMKYQAALDFARRKHEGQTRIGGLEYITHPMAVADMLRERGYGDEYIIAGLFHDLLEDTDATEGEILELGGANVLRAVKRLTKTEGYVMTDYVAAIAADPIARAVKAMDRLHNLRCAVVASEKFKLRYILESLEWYIPFDEEILEAVFALADTVPTLPDNVRLALDEARH